MKRQHTLRLLVALIMLGVLGVLGGLAEWSVRHREAVRETVPGGAVPGLFYFHNRTRFAFVRGADYFHWVHINRLGFRGKETTVEKEDGVFRILAVGGSTTFDRGVTADSLAWPARLEVQLNDLGGGQRFEVINAGVPGYAVLDNLIRLQTDLLELEPDLIILYHAHNNLFVALGRPVPEWSARPDEMIVLSRMDRWMEWSLLYAKVKSRLVILRNTRTIGNREKLPFPERLENGIEEFESHLTSFIATAHAHGIPVLLPTVVTVNSDQTDYWERSFVSASPTEVAVSYTAYNEAILAVGEALGASVLDTAPFAINEVRFYEDGDPIHFNNDGAAEMARQLGPVLIERLGRGDFRVPGDTSSSLPGDG